MGEVKIYITGEEQVVYFQPPKDSYKHYTELPIGLLFRLSQPKQYDNLPMLNCCVSKDGKYKLYNSIYYTVDYKGNGPKSKEQLQAYWGYTEKEVDAYLDNHPEEFEKIEVYVRQSKIKALDRHLRIEL